MEQGQLQYNTNNSFATFLKNGAAIYLQNSKGRVSDVVILANAGVASQYFIDSFAPANALQLTSYLRLLPNGKFWSSEVK
jgi:hypothetical protein